MVCTGWDLRFRRVRPGNRSTIHSITRYRVVHRSLRILVYEQSRETHVTKVLRDIYTGYHAVKYAVPSRDATILSGQRGYRESPSCGTTEITNR